MKISVSALKVAAEAGYSASQFELAALYDSGPAEMGYPQDVGVLQDVDEAAVWYEKAADQGFLPAIGALGVMLMEDRGSLQPSARRARALFHKAIEMGCIQSPHGLQILTTIIATVRTLA